MAKQQQFNNKVVWITGASSGIGAALAKVAAAAGAHVVLSARREAVLEEVRLALPNADLHLSVGLDITDEHQVNRAIEQILAAKGRIDVLINNAGLSQRALIAETSMQTERAIMEIDYFSQVYLTKQVLPILLQQKSGHIVFVSSVAGLLGTQYRASYSAAKAAIHLWANSLRAEVAEQGLKVSVLFPGFVKTNVSMNALNGEGQAQGFDNEVTANGLDVNEFARLSLNALQAGEEYIVVGGGKERLGTWLARVSPKLMYKMIRKTKVK
jgi:short-subunit dehydrogenase